MENDLLLWETKYWRVILADDQRYVGRAVIVAKTPERMSLSELTPDEWADFSTNVVRVYEAAVKKAFGAELSNWTCLMNLAYRNDPPDPHVHWHVRPRYRHPVEIDGEAYPDHEFGDHYAFRPAKTVSAQRAEMIRVKILEAIRNT